jgi:hypothetical protein
MEPLNLIFLENSHVSSLQGEEKLKQYFMKNAKSPKKLWQCFGSLFMD